MTPEHDATVALAMELLSRASVTPDDRGCQNLVAERLQACGFQCTSMNFGAVHNLWARRGSQAPLFCFAGHTDVVPPGDESQWRFAPFVPTISDGMLFARGAADMKSSIAAFITAAERFIAAHPDHPGSIALLLTSDEEGPAVDGTVKVVETLARQGIRMDYCLVGEPTSSTILGDMIKNGRRGSLTGILKIHGQQGHVAYPHLARNPIHLFAPALAELTECHWDDGNEFFPPTSFQIVDIHAGQHVSNVIPGSCDVMFNFRFASVNTPEALQKRVAAILDKHRLDWEIDWQLSGRPFLTGRGALVDALQRSITQITGTGAELSTSGGTSDGRFIADICDQVVEFGPVNATIHKVNEYIAVKDIAGLSAIYEKTLQTLLSSTTHSI